MLMRSKRSTQSQIGGRDAGATRLGAGGRLVGVELTLSWAELMGAGAAEGVPNPVQAVNTNKRINPNKWVSIDFIYTFFNYSIVHPCPFYWTRKWFPYPSEEGFFIRLLQV